MVAKEAHVVPSVRDLIVASAGVNDSPVWWDEIGEPINKLLRKKCGRWRGEHHLEIAAQLGRDFQKPWFGWKKDDSAAEDFDDVVYVEVVLRMVHPLYASHRERWIDTPLHNLRVAGIAASKSAPPAPPVTQTEFPKKYSLTTEWFLASEDKTHFLIVTQRPTRKSSPFIPAFDTSFEVSFKEVCFICSPRLHPARPGWNQVGVKKDKAIKGTPDGAAGVFIETLLDQSSGGDLSKLTPSTSPPGDDSRTFLTRASGKAGRRPAPHVLRDPDRVALHAAVSSSSRRKNTFDTAEIVYNPPQRLTTSSMFEDQRDPPAHSFESFGSSTSSVQRREELTHLQCQWNPPVRSVRLRLQTSKRSAPSSGTAGRLQGCADVVKALTDSAIVASQQEGRETSIAFRLGGGLLRLARLSP
ncbi:hypothetical protein K488DRAFT_86701 [Vararia minispora EC-137]|uniref:Uncharacterized protein n=1 Tax=Vararia minispora EC-137 TaxID=1314806 RepID=A0ACB8QJ16_9AGAM|nr:hypothetical protein K488DRAFT_86701 [Vararia minispora EC-137]